MISITTELDETLATLDPADARLLERLVTYAPALVGRRPGRLNQKEFPAVDAKGWPVGHFEEYAGAFAEEAFDMPEDSPPELNVATTDW
jgi:hypothetical protein